MKTTEILILTISIMAVVIAVILAFNGNKHYKP